MRTQMHHLVSGTAASNGDLPALTYKAATVSYQQLWQQIESVAAGLRGLGVERGERVAVYLEKRFETVAAIFGTSAAGAVFVPVNPLLKPKQVAYILSDCDVRVLVTSPERFEAVRNELATCPSLKCVVLTAAAPAAAATGPYSIVAWEAFNRASGDPQTVGAPGIDLDMAAIFYTSGSTGKPKGVVLSHRNLIVGAESVSSYLGNTSADVILSVLPLSFDAGFSQLTTGFSVGAHVVLVNYVLPDEVSRACARHRVTGITGVPPLWMQLTERSWPAHATEHVRYFANTGGRMPKATLDRLRRLFPAATPYLMYGLTEAFRSTYLDPAEVDRRPDSIGKAIPDAEILVVREDGSNCDAGEPGELVHRGGLVAMGYWNDPERTAERFKPAPGRAAGVCATEMAVWSGDVVVRDEAGFLYFVGRKDEMIKTSGYRISPTEIEEAVYDTRLVRDAVAFGVDDPKVGQHVVLMVSAAEGTEIDKGVLIAALKKQLPLYMMPQDLVVCASLPRSPNGKFDRNQLRQDWASLAQEAGQANVA